MSAKEVGPKDDERGDRADPPIRPRFTPEEIELLVKFFRIGLKLDRHSKSSDQIQLDIQVVLARNFITNLREEVKKGMRQKVRNGGFPAVAPVGYRNNTATAEIELDSEQAPIVKHLFE